MKMKKYITIFLVVFVSYYLTLKMFVWQDDHAVMFKLLHVSEPAGAFGTGIYDPGSTYKGVILMLYPIYFLFGLSTKMFYLGGIIAYFLASLAVYFFAKTLTKNNKVAFLSSLVFASGYVGMETLWRIFNSIHTSMSIVFICLALGFYKKFVDSSKVTFYLFSIIPFTLAMEAGFVRSHGIIILIAAVEILWNFNLLKSIVRLFPFAFIYYHYYIDGNTAGHELPELLNNIFIQQNFELLIFPFRNLQNMIIPSVWSVPLWVFVILCIFVYFKSKHKKILLYSTIFMLANYLVYFIHTPNQVFPSIHRYFSVSGIASAILLAQIGVDFFKKQGRIYLFVGIVIFVHIVMTNQENQNFINTITSPSRNFYNTLKVEVPKINLGDVFYFDIKDDLKSRSEFANFFGVGSMPNATAIAWQYGVDRSDVYIVYDFDEALKLGNFYSFYYDSALGLTNTTSITKSALSGKREPIEISNLEDINLIYTTPLEMQIDISTTLDMQKIVLANESMVDLDRYLNYVKSKRQYYDLVKAESLTYWETDEVSNLVDNDPKTNWVGDRLYWNKNHNDQVILDLKEVKTVGSIKLSHNYKNSTPTRFSYLCSKDKQNWEKLGQYFYIPIKESSFSTNTFAPKDCRYIKMDIEATLGDDSPRISELEVVDAFFSKLDLDIASEVGRDPFNYISTEADLKLVEKFVETEGMTSEYCCKTNKSINQYCDEFILFVNKYPEKYAFKIKPNGTLLESFEIIAPNSIRTELSNVKINYE